MERVSLNAAMLGWSRLRRGLLAIMPYCTQFSSNFRKNCRGRPCVTEKGGPGAYSKARCGQWCREVLTEASCHRVEVQGVDHAVVVEVPLHKVGDALPKVGGKHVEVE